MNLQNAHKVTRDQLPPTLDPVKMVPLRTYHREELEALAARPQKVCPLPAGLTEERRRKLSGLAQYRGRTPQGNLNSMANLGRWVKDMAKNKVAPVIPAGMPKPNIECVLPIGMRPEDTVSARARRVVLSQVEYDIYVEKWIEFWSQHGEEYNNPDDMLDVDRICVEQAYMHRLELRMVNEPNKDLTQSYNQAYLRQERARQNLANRRVDRVGSKSKGGTTNNNLFVISETASNLDDKRLQEMRQKALEDNSAVDKFLEGTVVHSEPVIPDEPTTQKQEGMEA